MSLEQRIREALLKKFEEEQIKDLFVVDIVFKKPSKLEVYIDSDNSVTLDTCRHMSRFLELQIEEKGWMPEKYTLDVSSPGLSRPLKYHRQYVKNVGRMLEITLSSDDKLNGILKLVNESNIVLESKQGEEINIDFDNIRKTLILVTF